MQKRLKRFVTISPVVSSPVMPSLHAGGVISTAIPFRMLPGGHLVPITEYGEPPEPLVETWSNKKVEAWRIIDVTDKRGDPDGLWLGFPHPDGPTADVATPVRHPVGVELHAECGYVSQFSIAMLVTSSRSPCDDVPGEHCKSGVGYGCGFYAFKTRAQAVAIMGNPFLGQYLAVARVLLSGKVIEHEDGYRAEILEVVEVEPLTHVVDSFEQEFSRTAKMLARSAALAQFRVPPANPYLLPPIPPTNPFINPGGGT